MKSHRLIVVGAGALGREVMNWVLDIADKESSLKLDGFLDKSPDVIKPYKYDVRYLGKIEEYLPKDEDRFVLGIGDPVKKRKIVNLLEDKGAQFITLIHPTAVIASSASIGRGVVVCPNSFISADARIGDFVMINGLSSVGHDVEVGAYTTLSAHVDLTGWVRVGKECFFGTGAKVMPRVMVGANSRIGAASLIMRNVNPGSVMYTLPAKKL